MSNKRELTEREKLVYKLGQARKYHRLAVRWLFDTSRLVSMYRDNSDSWKGGIYADIGGVAQQDHDDAMKEVVQTRQLVDRAAEKLKEYDANE